MAYTIKLKRGTTAQWAAEDPVLALGEPGVDTDTDELKIGNGVDVWSSLPGITGGGSGVDGNTILNGAGAPSSGLGVNGDFYINTTAKTIYGPKSGGAWGAATSLIGPTGATGADGAPGTDGVDGNDGAPGLTWRGAWSGTPGTYVANDAVTHDGQSYRRKVNGTSSTPPDQSSNWELLASRGYTGASGPIGPEGPPGVAPLIVLDAAEAVPGGTPAGTVVVRRP